MAADEPLITDDEIFETWDPTFLGFPPRAAVLSNARRIEALVRKRLADRLLRHNFASLKIPWSNLSIAQQAARIVEGADER